MTPPLLIDYYPTEIGTVITVFDHGILCALDFTDYESRCFQLLAKYAPGYILKPQPDPCGFRAILDRYLAGDYDAFKAVTISLKATAFQKLVWQALRHIPAGTTVSYSALARRINRPKASRAVGHANALNPVALVIPCHRVIGKNGALTGYAGGLARKRWLLDHEKTFDRR